MEQDYQKIISKPLLKWWKIHGRKNLPWQKNPSLYKTWVSEIMLQQTQVKTVIDYFERFIKRFPYLKTLAEGNIDDVLFLWSGLGYYSRARNLHLTANIIKDEFKGRFPRNFETLIALPGIGPSTAGAILSLSNIQSVPILDGNVKRVLARYFGVYGHYSKSAVNKKLWELSALTTPKEDYAIYTQAIMDLGATICLPRNPNCKKCPCIIDCFAYQEDLTDSLPTKKVSKEKKSVSENILIIKFEDGSFLLEKRHNDGIWGGLWSLPQLNIKEDPLIWCKNNLSNRVILSKKLEAIKHTFSHYHLNMHPTEINLEGKFTNPNKRIQSFKKSDINKLGLAAPIKKIINSL
ncbi:MAG: A/G-specific adenine glycosylase [Gammaproteobacteria bacterium]|nr:A/G-specific adenine glycosylase [Gammaproteobacteria bacterium]